MAYGLMPQSQVSCRGYLRAPLGTRKNSRKRNAILTAAWPTTTLTLVAK
jgi:hypothetical protein